MTAEQINLRAMDDECLMHYSDYWQAALEGPLVTPLHYILRRAAMETLRDIRAEAKRRYELARKKAV